jgi:anti-sigma B factor antagonist
MSDPALPAFEVVVTATNGAANVAVTGDVDTATAGELERALLEAAEGTSAVHVDLGSVSFIDSSGLRALIVARQAALDAGSEFGIVATTPAVDRLLRLTGLEDLLR